MIRSFKIEDSANKKKHGNQIASNFSKTNDLEKIINDKYTKILVYEIDSEIVGFLMYIELENTIDIVDIIVKEAYRNKKIASCLLDNLITELKEKIKWITLEVRKSNTPAIKLYQKFDFSIINTRKNYYENEDAYLMGREIKNER